MNKGNINDIFIKNYDGIYKASKKIANEWGKRSIPLTTLKSMTDMMKVDNTEISEDVIKNVHNLADTFYKTCENAAKSMHSKDISIEFIRRCVVMVKANIKAGC